MNVARLTHPLRMPAPIRLVASVSLTLLLMTARAPHVRAAELSPPATLIAVEREPEPAQVADLGSDWRVTFQKPDGQQFQMPIEQVVRWGAQPEPTGPYALMIDDSIVAGDLLELDDQQLAIGVDYDNSADRSLWEPSQLPLELVRGLVLQSPASMQERDALRRWLSEPVDQARVRLTNADQLMGRRPRLQKVAGPADTNAGGEPDRPAAKLLLDTASGEAPLPLSQLRAVSLNRALMRDAMRPQRSGSPVVRLGFRDGSSIVARSIEITGPTVVLTTLSGGRLLTTKRRLLRGLRMIQPLNPPQVDYLSDLPNAGYVHIPFLTTRWPSHGVDQNLRGGWLRHGDDLYAKGLAMHSTSRLAFDLGAGYRRFDAQLAIDALTKDVGSVTFRVYLDRGDGKFQPAYRSEIVRSGDDPLPLSLDVEGAQRMALIVDFGDRGDAGDHAVWLDARLLKSRPSQ